MFILPIMKKYLNFSLIFLIFLSGCSLEYKKYSSAEKFREIGQFATAIELFDDFIEKYPESSFACKAKISRSEAYYELGQISLKKENFELAKRFFFLANSQKADEKIDEVYYYFAQKASEQRDYEKAIKLYNFLIEFYPESEFISEILYKKIIIYNEELADYQKGWMTYKLLNHKYPDEYFIEDAESVINKHFSHLIDKAESFKGTKLEKIEKFEELIDCKTAYINEIKEKISMLYFSLAEDLYSEKKYMQTKKYYELARSFNSNLTEEISHRLTLICNDFVKEGKILLKDRDFISANTYFSATFDIKENYKPAKEALELSAKLEDSYEKAINFEKKAKKFEYDKNYSEAYKYYNLAYKSDNIERFKKKRFLMYNQVQIEKDAEGFAKTILKTYKKGKIIKKIENFNNQLINDYKKDNVHTPGWKYIMSFGDNKYEARYDIFLENKTYYFVWLINLKTQEITPLNDQTEEFLKL